MSLQPFSWKELEFAWCHRVYLHFRTHRRKPIELLEQLDQSTLSSLLDPYPIHVLESSVDSVDIRVLVSLHASDSVATAVSKIKGRVSKWITDHIEEPTSSNPKWLSRGYFASTTGKSTSDEVDAYLERQAEHHGYDRRARPPVFVQQYDHSEHDERILATNHAVTSLRYHLVLATEWRRGVFSQDSAPVVTSCWRALHDELRAVIQKVSFVPDHVHIAVMLHPAVSPAVVVESLMNIAQSLMREQFRNDTIRARLDRLWQSSAYVGSFGDLRSSAVAKYIRNWELLED